MYSHAVDLKELKVIHNQRHCKPRIVRGMITENTRYRNFLLENTRCKTDKMSLVYFYDHMTITDSLTIKNTDHVTNARVVSFGEPLLYRKSKKGHLSSRTHRQICSD